MIKVLHFADTHIDMASYGKRDPESGLPFRVLDFLTALDTIIDTAINEKVDLVLFAGDAYKDRTPVPTYQREWGKRIMRLSEAGIPTLLLVGNHDLSPTQGRAHALQEFRTLQVPHVRVVDRPVFFSAGDFENLPLQIMALPWVSRSVFVASEQDNDQKSVNIAQSMEEKLISLIDHWLERLDPQVPALFLAHASVQGAIYGNERTVMLGGDFVLPAGLLKDNRLDYVALGHIHKAQNLNENAHPPIIYPGSIERVDFGEIKDDKYFVTAHIDKGHTELDWRKLDGRKFLDCEITLNQDEEINSQILQCLPDAANARQAIIRVRIHYPKHLESMIDEPFIRDQLSEAFAVHLIRRPELELRTRLAVDTAMESLSPMALLNLYWDTKQLKGDRDMLIQLAATVMAKELGQEKEIL
jgi:exonuclease SbcD